MCRCTNSATSIHNLGEPRRIWAIPSVHSNVDGLTAIHDQLLEHFEAGDKIIYLGNYTGYGDTPVETLNEILTFRRIILSTLGVFPDDLIYLRGAQEEIFEKLWQLHCAPQAEQAFLWMLGNGLSATLKALHINTHEAHDAVRYGPQYLSRWINKTRKLIREQIDYDAFYINMKRAAISDDNTLLFVNSGLDYDKTLDQQDDSFWWKGDNFDDIKHQYNQFNWVVRGYDPKHRGVFVRKHYATLDNGSGFGGNLICTALDHSGEIVHYLEAA
jgi:serine/threonine protein phosphatase 1